MADAIAPSKSIFDQSYQSKSAEKHHLSLQISDHYVRFVLVDVPQNKVIAFEEYFFDIKGSTSQLEKHWKEIFDRDFFKLSFKSVSVYYVGRQSTMVPIDLYDKAEETNLLKLNYRLEANSKTNSDRIDVLGAYTVFASPSFLEKILDAHFVNYRMRHYSTPLLYQFLSSGKSTSGNSVYLNILKSHFEMIVLSNGELIFYNSFPYTNADDFLYYMLYALEKLQIDNEKTPFYLSGEIDKNTELYGLLFKYVKELKFLEKPKGINYSVLLKDLAEHKYYNLFSQYVCE